MKKVLFLPSLPHLDLPVLEKLSQNLLSDFELIKLESPNYFQTYEKNKSTLTEVQLIVEYGNKIRNMQLRKLTSYPHYFSKLKRYSSIIRSYQKTLNSTICEINPEVIISTSDHNFILDMISKTKFMERVIIIQPALITSRKHSKRSFIKNAVYELTNAIFRTNLFDTGLNWGDRAFSANYLLWSDYEDRNSYSKSAICGDFFMHNYPQIRYSTAPTVKRILLIMPNFSEEGPRVEQSYLDLLSQINISYPEVELTAKWHPSDLSDHKIFNFLRLKVIEDESPYSTNDFEMLISCVSALAVNLRRKFNRVAIFHPGYYGTLGKPYISQDHFFISEDICKIVEFVKNSNFYLDSSYIEIFAMDDKCRDLLASFLRLDHKRMV